MVLRNATAATWLAEFLLKWTLSGEYLIVSTRQIALLQQETNKKTAKEIVTVSAIRESYGNKKCMEERWSKPVVIVMAWTVLIISVQSLCVMGKNGLQVHYNRET